MPHSAPPHRQLTPAANELSRLGARPAQFAAVLQRGTGFFGKILRVSGVPRDGSGGFGESGRRARIAAGGFLLENKQIWVIFCGR